MSRLLVTIGVVVGVASACKGDRASGRDLDAGTTERVARDAAEATLEEPPLEPLPLGKTGLEGYAYSRGPGRKAFVSALIARRARDWPAVQAKCEEALLRDPGHLEAHWWLARARITQGQFEEALKPLSAAVAGDWQRWGEMSLAARVLSEFRKSPAGNRYIELAERYRELYRRQLGESLLLVGRRGNAGPPTRTGDAEINHRSEVYGYHLGTGRYLRVTRTNGSVVGFTRSMDGGEIAYVSYRAVWTPAPGDRGRGPYMRKVVIGGINIGTGVANRRDVEFADVRALDLWYDAEGQLLSRVFTSDRERPAVYSLDLEKGVETELPKGASPVGSFLHVEYDYARRYQASVAGVAADWDDERTAGAFRLLRARRTITVPESDAASLDSVAWSKEQTRLSFSTRPVDECSDDAGERKAKLYLVDAAAARLRAVAIGDGPFDSVWIDDSTLAYVDRATSEHSIRILDALTGNEVACLRDPGVGMTWLPSLKRCRPVRPPGGVAEDGFDSEEGLTFEDESVVDEIEPEADAGAERPPDGAAADAAHQE